MDKTYKFIKTQDPETKKTLESLGYQLVSFDGRTATFINDSKLHFDNEDLKNTTFSNILSV